MSPKHLPYPPPATRTPRDNRGYHRTPGRRDVGGYRDDEPGQRRRHDINPGRTRENHPGHARENVANISGTSCQSSTYGGYLDHEWTHRRPRESQNHSRNPERPGEPNRLSYLYSDSSETRRPVVREYIRSRSCEEERRRRGRREEERRGGGDGDRDGGRRRRRRRSLSPVRVERSLHRHRALTDTSSTSSTRPILPQGRRSEEEEEEEDDDDYERKDGLGKRICKTAKLLSGIMISMGLIMVFYVIISTIMGQSTPLDIFFDSPNEEILRPNQDVFGPNGDILVPSEDVLASSENILVPTEDILDSSEDIRSYDDSLNPYNYDIYNNYMELNRTLVRPELESDSHMIADSGNGNMVITGEKKDAEGRSYVAYIPVPLNNEEVEDEQEDEEEEEDSHDSQSSPSKPLYVPVMIVPGGQNPQPRPLPYPPRHLAPHRPIPHRPLRPFPPRPPIPSTRFPINRKVPNQPRPPFPRVPSLPQPHFSPSNISPNIRSDTFPHTNQPRLNMVPSNPSPNSLPPSNGFRNNNNGYSNNNNGFANNNGFSNNGFRGNNGVQNNNGIPQNNNNGYTNNGINNNNGMSDITNNPININSGQVMWNSLFEIMNRPKSNRPQNARNHPQNVPPGFPSPSIVPSRSHPLPNPPVPISRRVGPPQARRLDNNGPASSNTQPVLRPRLRPSSRMSGPLPKPLIRGPSRGFPRYRPPPPIPPPFGMPLVPRKRQVPIRSLPSHNPPKDFQYPRDSSSIQDILRYMNDKGRQNGYNGNEGNNWRDGGNGGSGMREEGSNNLPPGFHMGNQDHILGPNPFGGNDGQFGGNFESNGGNGENYEGNRGNFGGNGGNSGGVGGNYYSGENVGSAGSNNNFGGHSETTGGNGGNFGGNGGNYGGNGGNFWGSGITQFGGGGNGQTVSGGGGINLNSGAGNGGQRGVSSSSSNSKSKPFKIMLDVYPMETEHPRPFRSDISIPNNYNNIDRNNGNGYNNNGYNSGSNNNGYNNGNNYNNGYNNNNNYNTQNYNNDERFIPDDGNKHEVVLHLNLFSKNPGNRRTGNPGSLAMGRSGGVSLEVPLGGSVSPLEIYKAIMQRARTMDDTPQAQGHVMHAGQRDGGAPAGDTNTTRNESEIELFDVEEGPLLLDAIDRALRQLRDQLPPTLRFEVVKESTTERELYEAVNGVGAESGAAGNSGGTSGDKQGTLEINGETQLTDLEMGGSEIEMDATGKRRPPASLPYQPTGSQNYDYYDYYYYDYYLEDTNSTDTIPSSSDYKDPTTTITSTTTAEVLPTPC